jgi:hypothetical protein
MAFSKEDRRKKRKKKQQLQPSQILNTVYKYDRFNNVVIIPNNTKNQTPSTAESVKSKKVENKGRYGQNKGPQRWLKDMGKQVRVRSPAVLAGRVQVLKKQQLEERKALIQQIRETRHAL